jgi:acetyltransferase-like isoleucine patch superfamily enzyme
MKKILFAIIKRLPTNSLRVFFYRYFFKYRIGKNVEIGKCVINANKVEIGDNVLIRDCNNISCNILKINEGVSIHSGNKIIGSANFTIGKNSRIINDHYIDVYNNVTIGENTWLAGKNSQVWTHGSIHTKSGKDLTVCIGSNVYIGSNTSIAPGVKIGEINLIGLGSVVTKSYTESNNIIAGNPAVIVKENIDWRKKW